jgi:RIO kinase 1
MQTPQPLLDLIDDGLVQEIVRPLKSGKEASVYIVVADGRYCAAKVYKDAARRNFRQRQDYVEGRRVGDSRQQRAMNRGSRFGKQQSEAAWQTAEARAMARLHAAGVRVPRVIASADGVLVMDLVVDAHGDPAPQLAHVHLSRDAAARMHALLMKQVSLMLCAGLVHADLSEFNILAAADGPMIIDVPQAVEAVQNNNAKRLLTRDLDNVTRFLARFAPEVRRGQYAQEMWLLFQKSALKPDTVLTGRFQAATAAVDAEIILREVRAAKEEAAKREQVRQVRHEQALKKNRPT